MLQKLIDVEDQGLFRYTKFRLKGQARERCNVVGRRREKLETTNKWPKRLLVEKNLRGKEPDSGILVFGEHKAVI